MDRDEAARVLGVSPSTVARWMRQGLLRSRDGLSFERPELERWARKMGLTLGAVKGGRAPVEEDLLAGAVRRGAVTRDVQPATAMEAIEIAVGALPDLPPRGRSELLEAVADRERMASTALGAGVALPHPRKPPTDLTQEPRVSVVFPAQPIDWAALDGEPVHAVLLLISPGARVHLELLSRIAFALRDASFASFLREGPEHPDLVRRLQELRRDG
jgi:PTS system nitrogen regulatory IIA component